MSDQHRPADEPTRVDLKSADIVEPRVRALADLFPEAVRDGRIDLEALAAQLGQATETGPERFGLTWPGKADAIRMAQRPAEGALVPMPDESLEWNTTENVIIEGENLEVLKLLQRSYHGRVKLVYIDPPYNTGKDFVYSDNFTDPIGEYLRYSGQADENGGRLRANTETSGRYHSAWLSMMWPRLHTARSLLREDGVVAVSIDDIEAPRLREMLDEIFGEENFIAQFVWNTEGNVDNQSAVKSVHEYVICYGRDASAVPKPSVIDPNIPSDSKLFKEVIENSITKNGPKNPVSTVNLPVGFPCSFSEGSLVARTDQWPHILDPISVLAGQLVNRARVESGWSSRGLLDSFIANGCQPIVDGEGRTTWFNLTASGAIYQYKKRSTSQGHVLSVIRNVGTTKLASGALEKIGITFSYPKPVGLLKYVLTVFDAKDAIVLDFFAGAGTMGEAVLRQNAEDGGSRRFILVQLPEALGDANHPTIAHAARARVSATASDVAAATSTSTMPGFRSYRLSASAWSRLAPAAHSQLLMEDAQPAAERSDDALLAEVLLARGFDLVAPVEWIEIDGARVASVSDGALVVTFSARLGLALFEAMVDRLPGQIVVLEEAFVDDETKVNALQYLRAVNRRRDTDIELLLL